MLYNKKWIQNHYSSLFSSSVCGFIFRWSRMIDIDPWIAATLAFLLNVAQLRPSMARRDRMLSFGGYHDPSEPTTSGSTLPRCWYLVTFRLYAASRFSSMSYDTATSIMSRDPETWSSTSGLSRWPGMALLTVAANLLLVSRLARSSRMASCLAVARLRLKRQLLNTW